MKTQKVHMGNISIGGGGELVLIAGPCVVESEEACLDAARRIQKVVEMVDMPFVFKASFDKANRSSVSSYRGPGIEAGLAVLKRIKDECKVPILTDIHEPGQAERVAEVVDVLQIPALLARQTDLLCAAGRTGKAINIKKGQFMAPGDMRNVIEKVRSTGNENVVLTERGTSFGYRYLVSDMRNLPIMRSLGSPVVFDATHSVQIPGGLGDRSGGERQFVKVLARSAVAAGIDGLFVEVHPDPDKALSDGPNMLRIDELPAFLTLLKRIHQDVKACVEAEDLKS